MMMLLLRFFILNILIVVTGCGINGRPLSPSEASALGKKETLFPLGDKGEDSSEEAHNQRKKSYATLPELDQSGGDYSANFGIQNNTLDDVFERIKPKSGILKKRAVTPLQR